MAVTMTSIRLDTDLADEAVRVPGAKSRTEADHVALPGDRRAPAFQRSDEEKRGQTQVRGIR
jgi:hypothetical protein